jgi:hypothetical protein
MNRRTPHPEIERKQNTARIKWQPIGGDLPMFLAFIFAVAAECCALVLVGGGLYEVLVVDPFWPKRPDLIQPDRGGISRRRFWMPVHTLFEFSVISALVAAWSTPVVRSWLWVALISHAVARIWSFCDFIPKALAFERADPNSITEVSARKWTQRSIFRLPLEMITCGATIAAFARLVRM